MTLMTPMIDQDCLLAALADVGFGADKVEVHASPVALVGYEGSQRQQVANLVVRRRNVGHASNDLGFVSTPTGFAAIISDFDRGQYNADWMGRLNGRYTHHASERQARLDAQAKAEEAARRAALVEAQREAVVARAKKNGYRVTESRVGDQVRLVLVKRSY